MENADNKLLSPSNLAKLDKRFHQTIADKTSGLSPIEYFLAWIDWVSHLAISPGTRTLMIKELADRINHTACYSVQSIWNKEVQGPAHQVERRMSGEAWQKWPFKVFAQGHQSLKEWWQDAAMSVEGVRPEHKIQVHALFDQVLDVLSPANTPLTNPEVLQAIKEEKGKNLLRGLKHFVADKKRDILRNEPEQNSQFKIGENIGITPGKVVFRNDLIELLQYSPATEKVGAEPVLICPAWIMKYYILDLSPHNSLVKYLVEQGKTVFIISWKNPQEEDRDTGFEDYIHHGLMAAIDRVSEICVNQKINSVGYCIGGTLLSVVAALMAHNDDCRLNSITLLAAQSDFSEAGEILRFISPSQLFFLEKLMSRKGYLPSENMGGAFGSLRSSDLIFGTMVDRYFMGKESAPNDLMTWNADGTNMPHRMHAEYLTQLYLENRLSTNKFRVNGQVISLSDIKVPMFVVGTETDHVAPWQSVYKLHGLTHGELTFLLTSGGHNAGIVSGPEHPRRRYRMATRKLQDNYCAPEDWLEKTSINQGSWWPAWNAWLDQQITEQKAPPVMGGKGKARQILGEAPGEYVYG